MIHRYGAFISVSLSALSLCHPDDTAGFSGSRTVLPPTDRTDQAVVAQYGISRHLCLERVHETPISDLDPIALSTSEGEGMPPTVTMWSRRTLLVIRLSPDASTVESTFRGSLPTGNPLAAAVVGWPGGAPAAEVLDGVNGTVWSVDLAAARAPEAEGSVAGPPPAGAMRTAVGWVRVVRTPDASGDSSAIVLLGGGLANRAVGPGTPATAGAGQRNIDQVIHVRPGARSAILVTEAAFPFTTVAFTPEGLEIWRASPSPQELRGRLDEVDLRYVVATPGVDVNGAVLNTFVGLRSLRRLSALRLPDGTVRYEEIPGGLAFLGSFPRHRLLVATRSGDPYRLLLFRWRWTDRRQSCTTPQTGRLQ